MKVLALTMISIFVSATAFGAGPSVTGGVPGKPLASVTEKSWAKQRNCMINVLKTRIVTTLPDGSVTKEVKNTVYNNQVPNAVAFDVLAFKAAGAQLTARSGPTDAAYISIALVDSNGDESVLMEQESGKRQINESPEARKLVRFILANCRSK